MYSLLKNVIGKIDAVLASLEKSIIIIVLTVMLGFASTQVILRNFFHTGIFWADIFIRHLVLFLLFFGASLSTREKRHIQMDISSKIVPKKIRPYVNFFINAFCAVVNYYLFVAALQFMNDEKLSGSVLFAGLQGWYFIAVMPVGFALITFRFGLNLIQNLFVILGWEAPKEEEHIHVI